MGTAYSADPLRRSLTGVVTGVLAALTLAAGIYFVVSATRGATDPRPGMLATVDRLELPTEATLLGQRLTGGVACTDTGCPTVERFWQLPGSANELCPQIRLALRNWGGIRFQPLRTSACGYLGVMGPNRLAFSVDEATRVRLPSGIEPPATGTVLRVKLTRD